MSSYPTIHFSGRNLLLNFEGGLKVSTQSQLIHPAHFPQDSLGLPSNPSKVHRNKVAVREKGALERLGVQISTLKSWSW